MGINSFYETIIKIHNINVKEFPQWIIPFIEKLVKDHKLKLEAEKYELILDYSLLNDVYNRKSDVVESIIKNRVFPHPYKYYELLFCLTHIFKTSHFTEELSEISRGLRVS